MIHIIYPDDRMVDEETIIGWAKDELCDAVTGDHPYDETLAEYDAKIEAALAAVRESDAFRLMTLEDARRILEDRGSVTFADAHDPLPMRTYTGYGSDGFDINALPESVEVLSDEGEPEEPPACPACDGPGMFLGSLGNRVHFRCRNCGADFSHKG